jgi:hypothetical protein
MRHQPSAELVLGVSLSTRGIAFTLFEAPVSPIDWGTHDLTRRRRNARSLELVERLIARLHPEIVVLEDCTDPGNRKSQRIRRLQQLIQNHCHGQAIGVYCFGRSQIRACFKAAGAVTRPEIAKAIAGQVHAFSHRVPPTRRIWDGESPKMALFDAASLVMTYYAQPQFLGDAR